MPGYLVHVGATVTCQHGGAAQPMSPYPRVRVSNRQIVLQTGPYGVASCPFNAGGSPSPCVTAQWTSGAARITANGVPVVLQDSSATTIPNAAALKVRQTQTRVKGT